VETQQTVPVQDDQPLDEVLELAYVAGPGITPQGRHRFFVQTNDLPRQDAIVLVQEMRDQHREIFQSLPERWEFDRYHVDAVEKILPERPPRDHGPQVAIGRSDDPATHGDTCFPADSFERSLL